MPSPKKDEKEKDFISRCIPILVDEGKPHNQAIAICFSIYKKEGIETTEVSDTSKKALFLTLLDLEKRRKK